MYIALALLRCLSRIVVVFLYEGNRFGQQFHGCTVLVLTAEVLQPEVAVLVDGEVIIRDGHHIGVGYASVAGEQEHVTGEYMTFVLRVNLEVTEVPSPMLSTSWPLPSQRSHG